MSDGKEKMKELLHKKSLLEIEDMILEHKRHIHGETDMTTLYRLNSELSVMLEIHEQMQRESGRLIHKSDKASVKPELKSYEDFLKSKK